MREPPPLRHPAARGRCLALLMTVFAIVAGPAPASAAPRADLWERWTRHDPSSTKRIDHGNWQRLLTAYVTPAPDGVNRFAYGAVTAADRARLDAYLRRLAATPVSALARGEQLPFWINLYNALTIQVVLDHYPVDSIRDIDISPGLFASLFAGGPWDTKLIEIEGEALTLNDIEHRILRPIWQDPRIHYAVNCASIGCPNLRTEAYTADTVETLLDAGAREYVNHPRGARVSDGRLTVSSIYVWFQEDFGGSDTGVIAHLRRYADPRLASALRPIEEIGEDEYDWRLNDARAVGE